MSYTHLTTTERVKIETYLELGMSIRSIARRIGRQPSTVSREIRRNPGYESGRAQKRYEKAKTHCGAKTKLDDTMRRTIVEKLRATWSPNRSSAASTQEKLPSHHLPMDLCGTDRRARDRAPPEGETPKAGRNARSHQRRSPHLETAARGQGSPDVRALGARHRRLRTREVEGVRRDVRRAEEPVLSRPANHRPHRGLDGEGDPCGARRLPGRHVRDGDDGPGQRVQRSRAHPGVARRADVFRRPVFIVATGEQRERQRAPPRVLPERNGFRGGHA